MNNFFRGIAAALTLALLGLSASAQTPDRRAAVDQLMRKSGLWVQVGGIGAQVRAGLAASASRAVPPLATDVQRRLEVACEAAYAPSRMRAIVGATIAAGLRAEDVGALLAWYDSPLGKSITALEEKSTLEKTDSVTRLQKGSRLFASASPARQAVLRRLSEALNMAEITASLIINTTLGVQQGFAAAAPDRAGPSPAELRALLEAQRPQMEQQMEGMILAGFAASYERLSDVDIGRYADFAASPAGERFMTLSMEALDKAMVDGSTEFGRLLPGTRPAANS